ncbi:MAG: bifunctional DNA-formamidopyrimidine glycosylase/DNA-(apurinic or apyrimidinic site) lyase [Patescibacteria group bacterium]|jgi:formamidopyrimidine-DNA glycosylase
MPELPEVETVVRGLRSLIGKKIKSLVINKPKLVSVGPKVLSPKRIHDQSQVRQFTKVLQERKILGVQRRAKLIQIKLDRDWWLLVHLKMTGQMLIQQKNQKRLLAKLTNTPKAPLELLPSKHTHIIVNFTDSTKLYYNDVRVFGTWRAVKNQDLKKVKDLQDFGPEPLSKEFTIEVFKKNLNKRPNLKIKQALIEQSLIAGVGNIYADEALFWAKIRPTKSVKRIKTKEWLCLYKALQKVLIKAIARHGSSVGDFIRTNGKTGNYGNFHMVYGRKGLPCKICKKSIKRIAIGGRSSHFCAFCQK